MTGFHWWQFIAGIAVFVYAMFLIEQSIRNLAGRPFKKFLQRYSGSRLRMTAASALVTGVLQSSSVVLLMVLSFVGAGLMNVHGALAAALGANLGSTFINWIIVLVGFKIHFDDLSFPVLGVALIGLLFFRKNSRWTHITSFLIGFAFIFISLEWLKESADVSLADELGRLPSLHYLVFILIGFVVTGIIQSSSATVAITLTVLHNQLIPFESAAAMVIGSELGTTLKFLLGSIGGIPDKKRVAWGNFLLNVFTVIMAAVFMGPLVGFIQNLCGIKDPLIGIVAFQTVINFVSIVLFYPFLGVLAEFLQRRIQPQPDHAMTQFIRKSAIALPGDALTLTEKEIVHLLHDTIALNKRVFGHPEQVEKGWMSQIRKLTTSEEPIPESYDNLKRLHGEILEYITEIPKEGMTEAEIEKTGKLITIIRHVLRAAKNVKDIQHNLEEFEASANDDVFGLYQEMKRRVFAFYNVFMGYVDDAAYTDSSRIRELLHNNRQQYDDTIVVLINALKENKINELDSSSLLNVNREIYSANKALIRSLGDLIEIEEEES